MGRKKNIVGLLLDHIKNTAADSPCKSRMSRYNWVYRTKGSRVMDGTWLVQERYGNHRYTGALVAVGKKVMTLHIDDLDPDQAKVLRDAVLSIVKPEMTVREMAAEIGSLDWVR